MRSPLLSRLALSRRKLGFGLGTTLVGATASTRAAAGRTKPPPLQWSFAPVPIPTTSPYHVSGFSSPTDLNADPSTITNFSGSFGFATLSGMVTRTDRKTGEEVSLPFGTGNTTNMRFMTGTFVGADGDTYPGTFAFI
jgi:hypothetical protein